MTEFEESPIKKPEGVNSSATTGGPNPFQEDRGRKAIILLRWVLIIVIGYLVAFSFPSRPLFSLPYLVFVIYAFSNLFLIFSPFRWFEKEPFLFLILLFDIGMNSWAIFITARIDSEFYLIYYLILFIAAFTQRPKFIYFSSGLLIVIYGIFSYLKYPQLFREPIFLLRFPFIFIVSSFFTTMMESYNRAKQRQELLKEDYRELEVLTDLAQSIGQNKNLSDFLIILTQTLCNKLLIRRCMAILVDDQERQATMVSSEDGPGNAPIVIDLKKFPSLQKSLHKDMGELSKDMLPGNRDVSKHILKEVPILYQDNKLGTLYLRVNTPYRRLTHREEYFLSLLSQITATAIYNLKIHHDNIQLFAPERSMAET